MKGQRVARNVCLVLVIISALFSSLAEAGQTYSVQLQPAWFGNLNEHDLGESTCAPTAAINSFVFLQNAYPSIYGDALVPDPNGNGVTDYAESLASPRDERTLGACTWHKGRQGWGQASCAPNR